MIRKTDDLIILKMLEQGKTQKAIAEHFNVSPVAIHKRIKRILPPKEPESFSKLTEKEKRFAISIADGETKTQAALHSHDVSSLDSAKSLGHQLMQKPDIQMAVSELMQEEGLTRRHRVRKLKSHVNHADPGISLKALDQSWKLEGLYTDHHVFHVVTYADLQKTVEELEIEIAKEKAKLGIDVIEGEIVEEDSEEKDIENR